MAIKDHGTVFGHGVFQKVLQDRLKQANADLLKPENKETYKRLSLKANITLLEDLLKIYKKDLIKQLKLPKDFFTNGNEE